MCGYGKSKGLWSINGAATHSSLCNYDEEANRQEVYEHRIGKRPAAQALLSLIGSGPAPKTARRLVAANHRGELPEDTFEDLDRIRFEDPAVAMLLSKLADTDEQMVRQPKVDGRPGEYEYVDKRSILYQSTSTFNPANGKGSITLKLYIRSDLLEDVGKNGYNFTKQHIVTEIVGLWFGALPFRLSDIYPRNLPIISEKYANNTNHALVERATRCFDKRKPPSRYANVSPPTASMKKGWLKELLPFEKKIVTAHNKRLEELQKEGVYTFTGSSKYRGGICTDDATLKDHYR